MIIFKGFTVFLEDAFLEKPQKRGKGGLVKLNQPLLSPWPVKG